MNHATLPSIGPAQPGADLFGFSNTDLTNSVLRFASGVLSPSIWEGYRLAGSPMCIAASEINTGALARAAQYVREGGRLMIDSGAFVFRANPESMPWAKVFSVYQQLVSQATAPLTLILPDVVGCQSGSLARLREWGKKILALTEGTHHEALLPIQLGALSPAAFAEAALHTLDGMTPDGIALPSNAAAFAPSDIPLLADINSLIPKRVHFLGISRNSRGLGERLIRLQVIWPEAVISCDACEHRAEVGQGRAITVARATALADLNDSDLDEWDDTETDELDEVARAALRVQFPDADEDDLDHLMLSQVGSFATLQCFYTERSKANGPKATTASIRDYADRRKQAS